MMVPYPAPGTEMGSHVGTQLGTLFKSVPARSFAREGKTTNYPRRPPKLLNRRWVIRQVSHCGKPQRTAAPKKPLGFSAFAKLASGALPPWIPQQGLSDLCTPKHDSPASHPENHPPDVFRDIPSDCLRVPPLHPAKGIASPWNPACNIINLKGK